MNKQDLIQVLGVKNFEIINILSQSFVILSLLEASEAISRGIWLKEPLSPTVFQVTVFPGSKIMLVNAFYKCFSIYDKSLAGYGLQGKPVYSFDEGVVIAIEGHELIREKTTADAFFKAEYGQFIFFSKADDFDEGGYVQGLNVKELSDLVLKAWESGFEYDLMIMTR